MRWGRARLQAPIVADEDAGQKRAAHLTNEELTRIFMQIQPTLERAIENRLGNRHTAQDVAQNIYLRLERIADQLPNEEEARRYLMRMAIHAAIDHQRMESRHVQLLAGALTLFEGHVVSPEENAQAQDKLDTIEAALGELPAKCRDVLYLTRIEGLPREEVARRLGVSVSLVNKYVLLAMRHCAKKLEET